MRGGVTGLSLRASGQGTMYKTLRAHEQSGEILLSHFAMPVVNKGAIPSVRPSPKLPKPQAPNPEP